MSIGIGWIYVCFQFVSSYSSVDSAAFGWAKIIPKDLFIDVLIGLPELSDGTATPETVASAFRRMHIAREGDDPVYRLRLEARCEDDGTVEGEVSQELFWVETLDADPPADKRHPVSAADRGLIQLYYTPASRDAAAQIRATAGPLAARLLRAIKWSSDTEEAVTEASETLTEPSREKPRSPRSVRRFSKAGRGFTMMWSIPSHDSAWSAGASRRW